MLWLLQIPAPILGFLWVTVIVGVSVGGLVLFRKADSHTRLEHANAFSGTVLQLAGVLYAVLVAFVVVVVWELFNVWQTYLSIQPETRNEIAFFDHAIVRLNDLSAARKMRVSTGEASVPGEL